MVEGEGPGERIDKAAISEVQFEGSKIKRDGLTVGTPAPIFRLPRVGGGELSTQSLREARESAISPRTRKGRKHR
jgi:hypothetical protein